MVKKNGYVIDNVIDKLKHCKQLLGMGKSIQYGMVTCLMSNLIIL